MTLAAGTKLGPYEILAPLGAGGMGEVYRARDTKLGREVALKVLLEAFAADAERMARFEREAKVLASLNHPNIATIHGLEESNGLRALVMELVEGPTLAERIAQGPIPLDEALPIAKQIAEGLEYAHERGIIHRDLKPANIKITPDGAVKLLDFGLAKALDDEASPTDASHSPTLTVAATRAGVILGTAAYMSPEQARGHAADRRADIWSFGVVLYQVLTGKPCFEGETVSDTLAAVLRAEIPLDALPADTPPPIRKLLRRCLERDRKRRLRDIGEARIAIEEYLANPADASVLMSAVAAPAPPLWRRVLPWATAGAFCVFAAILAFAYFRAGSAPAAQSSMQFSAVTNFAGVQSDPSLSPDGRSVAFVSNLDGNYNIYVGLTGGGNLVQITKDPNLELRPMWSPDGTTLAYARLDHSGIWDIWEVPALGGTPRRVILNATDPAWSPDGHSLAYENMANGAIWISGISGENARQAVPRKLLGREDAEPRFSPDGRQIAFIQKATGPSGDLEVADLASSKVRQLTQYRSLALSPAWSPDGRFIYFASSRGGTMNIWKIAPSGGNPVQITLGQGDDAQVDVSADGKRIVFSTWRVSEKIARVDLQAKPGDQKVKLLTTDPVRNQLAPAYSPDGKRLAYFSNLKAVERGRIWVSNADGSDPVQLVQDNRYNILPQWTPDGRHLIYWSSGTGGLQFRSVPVSGGSPRTILKLNASPYFDAGPDRRLLFIDADGVESFNPRDGKKRTLATFTKNLRSLAQIPENLPPAPMRWSPDGRSIAYIVAPSREDDPKAGIWVDDFKNPPRQIFRGWVDWWLARGPHDEIYFVKDSPDLKGELWKVGWNGKGLSRTSITVPMTHSYSAIPGRTSPTYSSFAISPDGRYVAFETQAILQANLGVLEDEK